MPDLAAILARTPGRPLRVPSRERSGAPGAAPGALCRGPSEGGRARSLAAHAEAPGAPPHRRAPTPVGRRATKERRGPCVRPQSPDTRPEESRVATPGAAKCAANGQCRAVDERTMRTGRQAAPERAVRSRAGGLRLLGRPMLAGLRDPTDHRPLPAAHDDCGPADLPVGQATRIVGERVAIPPNDVHERGPHPRRQRRALDPRLEQGAMVSVAPLLAAVTVLFIGFGERVRKHGTDPLVSRPTAALLRTDHAERLIREP